MISSRIKGYRCLKKVIHQINRKNEWLLLSASFTEKFGLVFVLTLENTKRKNMVFLRNGARDFQNSPPFERCFYVTISGIFERFQYFNFEIDFLENKSILKKLEYCFLVESIKIENALFPYKAANQKPMLRTNRMVSTKYKMDL